MGIEPLSADIKVRPNVVYGKKADRHAQAGNALSTEQWMGLADQFVDSMALLLDIKSGKPIYLLRGDQRRPQIAVEVDFATKRPRTITNAVVSAYEATLDDLKDRIRRGDLVLLRGGLE